MKAYLSLLVGIIFLYSCTPGVEPINFGEDQCDFCKMSIVDQRYGAEIVTSKGKVFKYDATECMINALCENQKNEATFLHSAYTVDFTNPTQLVDVQTSLFLISESLPSPMGAYISTFPDEGNVSAAKQMHGGETYDWASLYNLRTGKKSCKDGK